MRLNCVVLSHVIGICTFDADGVSGCDLDRLDRFGLAEDIKVGGRIDLCLVIRRKVKKATDPRISISLVELDRDRVTHVLHRGESRGTNTRGHVQNQVTRLAHRADITFGKHRMKGSRVSVIRVAGRALKDRRIVRHPIGRQLPAIA